VLGSQGSGTSSYGEVKLQVCWVLAKKQDRGALGNWPVRWANKLTLLMVYPTFKIWRTMGCCVTKQPMKHIQTLRTLLFRSQKTGRLLKQRGSTAEWHFVMCDPAILFAVGPLPRSCLLAQPPQALGQNSPMAPRNASEVRVRITHNVFAQFLDENPP